MNIPKVVQTLKKCSPPKNIIDDLIKIFDNGGKKVDKEMLRCNPNAKMQIPYVSVSKPVQINDGTYKMNTNEYSGKWLYCGQGWYVRKTDKYEFAQYLAYYTKTRTYGEPWDARTHSV